MEIQWTQGDESMLYPGKPRWTGIGKDNLGEETQYAITPGYSEQWLLTISNKFGAMKMPTMHIRHDSSITPAKSVLMLKALAQAVEDNALAI